MSLTSHKALLRKKKTKQNSKIQHLSKPLRPLERTSRYRSLPLVALNDSNSASGFGQSDAANQPPNSATIFIPFMALCDPGISGGLFGLFGFFLLYFFSFITENTTCIKY